MPEKDHPQVEEENCRKHNSVTGERHYVQEDTCPYAKIDMLIVRLLHIRL